MKATAIGSTVVKQDTGSLEIVIPPPTNRVTLIILTVVLAFWWLAGGSIAAQQLSNYQNMEVYNWAWLIFGLIVILLWLRNLWFALFMKEIVRFENDKLIIKKSGQPFVVNKIFKLSKIRRFAVTEQYAKDRSFWNSKDDVYIGTGTISFKYGKKVVSFGESLNESDALAILTHLKEKKVIPFQSQPATAQVNVL